MEIIHITYIKNTFTSDIFKIYTIKGEYKDKPHLWKESECIICNRKYDKIAKYDDNKRNTCCDYCSTYVNSLKRTNGHYILCRICDKVIWKSKSSNKKVCSKKCSDILFSISTPERNKDKLIIGRHKYYGSDWLTRRRECRRRDDYTCVKCNINEEKYGKELSVHHIKPFVYFESHIEANQLTNLISVCEPCHRKIHSNDMHHSKYDYKLIKNLNNDTSHFNKRRNKALVVYDMLVNTNYNFSEIKRELSDLNVSYQLISEIYYGKTWSELYSEPPCITNHRKTINMRKLK